MHRLAFNKKDSMLNILTKKNDNLNIDSAIVGSINARS